MVSIVDATSRAEAINPVGSYCVSAPAGSGKTELLIQRYLALLARVERPEQVLAITFTRKAAAEMRERVLQALQAASDDQPCISEHEQVTRNLARRALAVDARGGWYLQRDISRLNIKTIDSFCAGLTRQMPVLSQFGGQLAIRDDATELYLEAVSELFAHLSRNSTVAADLSALLLHFDNNWERLQALLVSMLARREQWRAYVGVHHQPEESAAYLLAAVEALVRDDLALLSQEMAPYESQILDLQQFASSNLSRPAPQKFPADTAQSLPLWDGVRELLLTTSGGWRKRITKREGFPADAGIASQRKAQLQTLIAELSDIAGLRERLAASSRLPRMDSNQGAWQLVLHLSRLLPVLAAELLLVFGKYGAVDYSQVAQSALLALGEDDAPTDLALRLDYQIEHILVDEFQDTAVNQFELLHKLTRGWGDYNAASPDAPRTLLIVGDGMQSIYSFRGANVGLFLKAQRDGFNGVTLTHLQLACNFRSEQGVVHWVNDTFSKAFPKQDNINRSQVSYSSAVAVREPGSEPAVALHGFCGEQARAQEVAFICEQIARQATRGQSIAVLGRSRGHLQPIIIGLKVLGVPYSAQGLDRLSQSPLVRDMMTLCRALANDADRLAWMSLLRGPCCGLLLADLLAIAQFGKYPAFTNVRCALAEPECQVLLSDDGLARVHAIVPALARAHRQRDRLGLRALVEQIWVDTGGAASAIDTFALEDAESFLQLLEEAERDGVGLDVSWLENRLDSQFANGGAADSTVQLMTLHKAKGLEFDRVIIPQLDKRTRGDDRPLLLWDEHSNDRGERSFLLAAEDHCDGAAPTLYNYLRQQRQQKTLLETTRLLYVGATRAAQHLTITACLGWGEKEDQAKKPSKQSLLSPIWQTFEQQMNLHRSSDAAPAANAELTSPRLLSRLQRQTRTDSSRTSVLPEPAEGTGNVPQPEDNQLQRRVGTVVHLALEELSLCDSLPQTTSGACRLRWRIALQQQGVARRDLDMALDSVCESVTTSLSAGGRGRWLLSQEHVDAHSEWALTIADEDGGLRDIVIDRSFVDPRSGIRWIVDYKNSRPQLGESMSDFLQRESTHYSEQLLGYRGALATLVLEPLRCALFFSALNQLYVIEALDLPAREA